MTWRYVEARDAGAPLPGRLLGVWRHRRLWRRMAERDLRQRYVGSALGLAWTALSPLLFVAVYVSIFTFVFGARLSPGAPTAEYALYVLSGLLPWVAFSDVAGRATQTMAEHRNLVKFAVFPVQILPLTSLYAVAFSQGIGLVLAAAPLHLAATGACRRRCGCCPWCCSFRCCSWPAWPGCWAPWGPSCATSRRWCS